MMAGNHFGADYEDEEVLVEGKPEGSSFVRRLSIRNSVSNNSSSRTNSPSSSEYGF